MGLYDKIRITPLVIDFNGERGARLASHIFPLLGQEGCLFVDTFWPEKGTNSFHRLGPAPIEGDLDGAGPWKVGGVTIHELDPEAYPQLAREWAIWEAYLEALTDKQRETYQDSLEYNVRLNGGYHVDLSKRGSSIDRKE